MIATVLVFLFIGQILSFYFIILLYTKISRLKDVEKSQAKLKDEMDNAVGAYLAEMRDENDRLIKELTMMNEKSIKDDKKVKYLKEDMENAQHHSTAHKEVNGPTYNMPRNMVAKAYQNSTISTATSNDSILKENAKVDREPTLTPTVTLTLEEQIQDLYRKGKSVDEIAKLLQKGKTEIELLLKFQH